MSTSNQPTLMPHPVIEILAGSEKQVHRAHIAAFKASKSDSLDALVSERWNEGKNCGTIDWSYWNVKTVERVLSWLYGRSCTIPNPQRWRESDGDLADRQLSIEGEQGDMAEKTSVAVAPTGMIGNTSDMGAWAPTTCEAEKQHLQGTPSRQTMNDGGDDDKCSGLQTVLWDCYAITSNTTDVQGSEWKLETSNVYDPALGFDAEEFPHSEFTYGDALLALAQLHHFAAYHLCESLHKSTLRGIADLFGAFDCTRPHAVSDLAMLIDYVYANIPGDAMGCAVRQEISRFVVANQADLLHDEFPSIMFRGDDFTTDIAQSLSRQLLARKANDLEILSRQSYIDSLKAPRQRPAVAPRRTGRQDDMDDWSCSD